ncbi:hypothetical protein SKAU_G00343860 [Synaphobranchus kaupii]|uniref:Uncharacterized protein n=1 Tax=Synaphobranchus kaupii TaxID=118154 RepID=A0A9Q1EJ86_SYNKA|nr:hypothetical protein SKAU_G00343860 [Synaphobranchus kaupii]
MNTWSNAYTIPPRNITHIYNSSFREEGGKKKNNDGKGRESPQTAGFGKGKGFLTPGTMPRKTAERRKGLTVRSYTAAVVQRNYEKRASSQRLVAATEDEWEMTK